ncbi:TPA: WxL domain-containing protein, partial [Enterococcus faecalis]|nr:WxL domain-containing protein [Enterococcus faecalis]EKR9304057.1 WxL domain-containing protein [Enterococcus faecalis]HBG9548390.1 WxL domain-containing protein [Enterococcus faecalis]
MKQTKWQRLAAIGLCGSLLVNAFSGVTAVAETVTIESSPTAESSVKEETQASSETQETTTETSREEVTQETEKQAEVAVEKKEAPPVKAEQKEAEAQQEVQLPPQLPVQIQNRAIGVKAGNLVSLDSQFRELSRNERNRTQLVTPEARLGLNLTSKDNTPLNTSDFKLKTEMGLTRWIVTTTTSGWFVISDQTIIAPNVPTETGIDIILPSQTAVIGFVYRSDISLYYLKDPELTVPKYIDTVELEAPVGGYTYRLYFGATGIGNPPNVGDYLMNVSLVKTNDTYVINQPKGAVWPVSPAPPVAYQAEIRSSPAASINPNVSTSGFRAIQQDYNLVVTHKKVTENFVDATGAKITPPTGFTQGQQTSITSNDFTYTSAKALPDTYKAGGKTYKFKGWYKGTDQTALKTTKTPSYAVTYDDQDDMTAVYEVDTGKDYNFPSKTVNFQFIDEAGTIISPTPFTITTDLQQEINSTYTKLGSITGINSGNTKRVTIPAKTIRADVSLGGVNNYGTTNTRITIPKFYENIFVYTGSAYTQATLNRYSTADNTLIGNPTSNAPLYYGLNKMTTTQFKVSEYDSTTTIPEQSEYLYNRLYVSGASRLFNSYVTPVGTIYYQLTNRKVTENFVDASGAKITPPTGFTQGNKVVIDSENFTYTSAKALPDTYTVGDKNYKFKGWYKGTDQTKMKTTKTPSYAVTYDDKDDMTAVYEEVQEITVHPGFYAEFVDEQGKAFTNPLTLSGNYTEFFRKTATSPFEATGSLYPMVGSKEATVANRYKVET